MARTLPWLKTSGVSTDTTKSRSRPAKKPRLLNLDSDEDVLSSTRISVQGGRARTPSTSPPPEPPSEEFMQEGLDRDDIYIMVEDEFQAVAKTFTQHLHHAEYVRLRNLARAQEKSTITNLSRPVDSITKMREETKRKKQQEINAARHGAALEKLKTNIQRRSSELGSDHDNQPEEDEKLDDPWVGTTLQNLMTKSPRKPLVSLTGLQRVKSSTRAAAGYPVPEQPPPRNPRIYDISPNPSRPAAEPEPLSPEKNDNGSASTEDDDDDDLDAPLSKKPLSRKKCNENPTRDAARGILKRPRAPLSPPPDSPRYPRFEPARNKLRLPSPVSPSILTTSISKRSSDEGSASLQKSLPTAQGDDSYSKRRMLRVAELRAKRKAKGESDKATETGGIREIPTFLV